MKTRTNKGKFYALILAGGKGERFWPMSTSKKPKQLLSLFGNRPMILMALDRLNGLIPEENIFIITNKELVKPISSALPDFPERQIIGEPVGRDTAAAISLGAALIERRNPDASFCVLTADHIIADIDKFHECLLNALKLAESEEKLITIGIKPTEPSTGFGYIHIKEKPACRIENTPFYPVKRFVEKPPLKLAKKYVASGNFFWNSGMFIWSVKTFKKAIANNAPHLLPLIDAVKNSKDNKKDLDKTLSAIYPGLEKISIDYALMEKARNVVMLKASFGWDDVGSWVALQKHFPKDKHNNIVIGHSEMIDSCNNIVISDEKLIAMIGVSDLVIVQHQGTTLISHKKCAQDVKKIVAKLRECPACRKFL